MLGFPGQLIKLAIPSACVNHIPFAHDFPSTHFNHLKMSKESQTNKSDSGHNDVP